MFTKFHRFLILALTPVFLVLIVHADQPGLTQGTPQITALGMLGRGWSCSPGPAGRGSGAAKAARAAGVIPGEADAFIAACRTTYGLQPQGLMCIPPMDEPAGPHFALLAKIAARNGLAKLSMGMSDDFEDAILEGSTIVRVGTAIFGPR
jgi:hypothetical protein